MDCQELERAFNEIAASLKKRSDELASEQGKLRSIHHSIADGLIVMGASGFITSANPSAQVILNRAEAELAGSRSTGITDIDELLSRPELVKKSDMMRCWLHFECQRRECPSFENPDLRCWLNCGNHSHGEIGNTYTRKLDTCERCPVFRNNSRVATDTEIDGRNYTVSVSPIINDAGKAEGRLAVLHDVTDERLRLRQLDLLYRISSTINTAGDIDDLAGRSLALCMEAMQAAGGAILLREDGDVLRVAAKKGLAADSLDYLGRNTGEGIAGWVIRKGEPLFISDGSSHQRFFVSRQMRDSLFIPINNEKKSIGVLCLSKNMSGGFVAADIDFLWPVAMQIGAAASRFRLNEKIADEKEKQGAIVESMGENLCVIGTDRVIQFANTVCKNTFGEDCVGRRCHEVFMGRTSPCKRCTMEQCLSSGDTVRHSYFAIDKLGTRRLLETTLSPVRDSDGRITSCIQVSRDITELLHIKNQSESRLNALTTLFKISHTISSSLELDSIVEKLADSTQSALNASMVAIMLFDDESGSLILESLAGNSGGWHVDVGDEIDLSSDNLKQLASSRKPLHAGGDGEATSTLAALAPPDAQSILVGRLSSRGKLLGIMVAASEQQQAFSEAGKKELFIDINNQASMAIDNAGMYKQLEDTFWDTIRSLAEAIDAKDSYTRGHSDRVALYAEALARKIRLEGDLLDAVRYAGYLHDTGKIGVPDAILHKAGRLTDQEYTLIMNHPVLSHKIIEPVDFLCDVKPLVLYHHERIDGAGYPNGLKGDEIPLGARIIGIADAFEAMTSDRPYRKALSQEAAIDELRICAGTQFDSDLVEAFIEVLEEVEIS